MNQSIIETSQLHLSWRALVERASPAILNPLATTAGQGMGKTNENETKAE
jgi:hypothetical protein